MIRKLNLGQSKHLTDLYKKMYAEMTKKNAKKLKKRRLMDASYSRSKSEDSSVSGHKE